jgi:hypothetical protein
MEIWKPIEGYETLYEVSNYGRVKSKERFTTGKRNRKLPSKILKPFENNGYLRVSLCKDGKSRDIRVHRLVAIAFIENHQNKPYINHKDGNPGNNHFTNLEWCTQKENIRHAYKTGLAKRHGKLRELDEYILRTYKRYSKTNNFRTMAREIGAHWTTICRRYHQLVNDPKYVNKFATW